MAQLPPDGKWLMQQIGGQVIIFNRYTEQELVRYDSTDRDLTARMQKTIHELEELNDEQKAMAHFWAGYFYSQAVDWEHNV